jgi:type II secretory pathway pseudopilin PulG
MKAPPATLIAPRWAARRPSGCSHRGRSHSPARGFTLIEVTLAASVMLFAIATSLTVLHYSLQAVDNARYTTLAGQILQSQMEKLRLLTWAQLTDPTYGPSAPGNTSFTPDNSLSTPELSHFTACTQTLSDPPAPFAGSMKDITLTATWTDTFGRQHSLSYTTRYGQNGISDFFYTSH